jgi:hypothetical protein
MMGSPLAHIGGLPLEETLASFGPMLVLVAGATSAKFAARIRHLRRRQRRRGGAADPKPS